MAKSVLIISDIFQIRLATRNMLKGYADEIHEASSGEAVEMLKDSTADLIICDQDMMPTGLTLLSYLKDEGKHIPFILLASDSTPNFVLTAKKAGVNGFLIKPFAPNQLVSQFVRIFPECK